MTDWLHSHKFSYKKPKGSPAKGDLVKYNGLNIIKSS